MALAEQFAKGVHNGIKRLSRRTDTIFNGSVPSGLNVGFVGRQNVGLHQVNDMIFDRLRLRLEEALRCSLNASIV